MKKLLVIVDMVNGFINQGALADKKINKITPVIVDLVKNAIKENTPIIAFKDAHTKNDPEFAFYPPHCIKGTAECELIPELKPFESKFISIKKNTTNGFNTGAFKHIISNLKFEEIVIVGCCTDICVEAFALTLKKFIDAAQRKTKIVVVENGVYTFDSPTHSATQNHNAALQRMKNAGIEVKTAHKTHEKGEWLWTIIYLLIFMNSQWAKHTLCKTNISKLHILMCFLGAFQTVAVLLLQMALGKLLNICKTLLS